MERGIPLVRMSSEPDAPVMESVRLSSEAGHRAGKSSICQGKASPSGERSLRAADKPRLWTAWLDYSATGEGRAYMACIAYAQGEAEILAHFGNRFDPWFANGCDVGQGVVRNCVTTLLWSATMLDRLEVLADEGAWVEAHSWMHFNRMSL